MNVIIAIIIIIALIGIAIIIFKKYQEPEYKDEFKLGGSGITSAQILSTLKSEAKSSAKNMSTDLINTTVNNRKELIAPLVDALDDTKINLIPVLDIKVKGTQLGEVKVNNILNNVDKIFDILEKHDVYARIERLESAAAELISEGATLLIAPIIQTILLHPIDSAKGGLAVVLQPFILMFLGNPLIFPGVLILIATGHGGILREGFQKLLAAMVTSSLDFYEVFLHPLINDRMELEKVIRDIDFEGELTKYGINPEPFKLYSEAVYKYQDKVQTVFSPSELKGMVKNIEEANSNDELLKALIAIPMALKDIMMNFVTCGLMQLKFIKALNPTHLKQYLEKTDVIVTVDPEHVNIEKLKKIIGPNVTIKSKKSKPDQKFITKMIDNPKLTAIVESEHPIQDVMNSPLIMKESQKVIDSIKEVFNKEFHRQTTRVGEKVDSKVEKGFNKLFHKHS